ncbi:MAG: hypothetical protein FJ304_04055 [Planctomycetes bacterium]|nr:hypothetical protein [Planctomycetota bacterium]
MNGNCPTCGALYNVGEKDIGRKLKCKKCSSALMVSDEGLVLDDGKGAPASDPKPKRDTADSDDDRDDESLVKKNKGSRPRGPGALAGIGGLPTLLFGIGVFFVIAFTSFPIIGVAGSERAKGYVEKLEHEVSVKKFALLPKGKKLADLSEAERKDINDKSDKIDEEFGRKIAEAKLDAEGTRISNKRDTWFEAYGLMFGFMFLAFGCVGFLRTDQTLTLKIVAAVVLSVMLIVMFGKFGGCTGPR